MKSKKVTKKQLLAAACTSNQVRLIKRHWPWQWKGEISLRRVVERARRKGIPYIIITGIIKAIDPNGWTEMWTAIRSDTTDPEEQVARYLYQEKQKVAKEEDLMASGFIPSYWWERSFARGLIAKGLNPTYPFAPPWYPRHVSERETTRDPLGWDIPWIPRSITEEEYREMHEAQFPSSRKEKTVTKFITKKQLLAAACTGDQAKLIEKHWPAGGHKMSLRWIIYRAAGLDIPFHTIGVLIQLVDPSKWVAVAKGPFHRIDYKASVEQYVRRGEETRPGRRSLYESWHLPVGNLEDELKAEEKTVTKTFTKKQLLDAICDDRYTKVIENYWPFGKSELAIREIVAIARRLQEVSIYAVGDRQIVDLIHVLDRDGLAESAGGIDVITTPFKDRQPTRLVNCYLKWDKERILEGLRPTIEEAMKRPETRTPDFDSIVQEIVYHSGWSPEKVIKFLSEQPRRADMTLKETVALIEEYRKQLGSSYGRYAIPYIEIFGDGSWQIKEGISEDVHLGSNSIKDLEEKLKELIANK